MFHKVYSKRLCSFNYHFWKFVKKFLQLQYREIVTRKIWWLGGEAPLRFFWYQSVLLQITHLLFFGGFYVIFFVSFAKHKGVQMHLFFSNESNLRIVHLLFWESPRYCKFFFHWKTTKTAKWTCENQCDTNSKPRKYHFNVN